jgi:hypothetical protein
MPGSDMAAAGGKIANRKSQKPNHEATSKSQITKANPKSEKPNPKRQIPNPIASRNPKPSESMTGGGQTSFPPRIGCFVVF